MIFVKFKNGFGVERKSFSQNGEVYLVSGEFHARTFAFILKKTLSGAFYKL